jgi:uncharacterized membrane protein
MFDKIFNKKVVVPFFTIMGVVAIFQWIIFPGLTAANTIMNVLAVIITFFTGVFVYYSLGIDTIVSNYINSDGLVDTNELKQAEEILKEKPKAKRKPKTQK